MADHSKPSLTSNYSTEFLPQLHGRVDDVAKMLDSTDTAPTNQPSGAIRINRSIASLQRWTGTAWATFGGYIPSGTVMLFQQANAPLGWTKLTTHNDKALRVVSGTPGSGGATAFSAVFAARAVSGSVSGSNGATTDTGTIGSTATGGTVAATASAAVPVNLGSPIPIYSQSGFDTVITGYTNPTNVSRYEHSHVFSGGSHSHSLAMGGHNHTWSGSLSISNLDMAVQYVDVILASKD